MARFLATFQLLIITLFCVVALNPTQEIVDTIADNLQVRFNVVDNRSGRINIVFHNKGSTSLTKGGWAVYFSAMALINGDANSHISITHLNGLLHKMTPSSTFDGISPGTEIVTYGKASFPMYSKSTIMPNWFVVAEGCFPRIIRSTSGEDLGFVGDFLTPKSWKRSFLDTHNPFSSTERFAVNGGIDYAPDSVQRIIPKPRQFYVEHPSTSLRLSDYEWEIKCDNHLLFEKEYLVENMKTFNVNKKESSGNIISLRTDSSLKDSEKYTLEIVTDHNFIMIVGGSSAGVFYGIQSLLSLWNAKGTLQNTRITDAPRYKYRGILLDVARNFRPVRDVKRLLETMSMYKLNKLHLHLTDDQGWRLEIRGLPELTETGGKRCFDIDETTCLPPDLGSGPDTSSSGSGFYTEAEYRDILKFAADRHIEVIPEIDSPGHGRAAIKSMEARYRKLMKIGKRDQAIQYLVSDMEDKSTYFTIYGYRDNSMNPCMNSTYTFFRHVIGEVKRLHQEVNPLKTFHFGGDEVAKGSWTDSPACQNIQLQSHENVKAHFVRKISSILKEEDLILAGWEDGLMDGSHPISLSGIYDDDVYVNAWNNVWGSPSTAAAHTFANIGHKVVMSQATHLYFDHPYEPNPEEHGLAWATRFTSMRKAFGFQPEKLFKNADVDLNGNSISSWTLCGWFWRNCVELKKPQNIIGMQGHAWTDLIRTTDQMDYMLFPRLLALAERAWHKAEWEDENVTGVFNNDWMDFVTSVGYNELKRLDRMGIKYRVPPPGGTVVNERLLVNVEIPGLTVEYIKDGWDKWQVARNGTTHVDEQSVVFLRTRSADGKRYSTIVRLGMRENSVSTISLWEIGLFSTIIIIVFVAIRLRLMRQIFNVLCTACVKRMKFP